MGTRIARTRWFLLVALAAAPGCLFRPIFHPPTDRGGDAAAGTDVVVRDAPAAADAAFDSGAPFDASAGSDVPPVPSDDCRDYYDPTTGMYYPDAHHEDGALCELPTDAGTADVTPTPDASDTGGADDAASDDAADDATSIDDSAIDDGSTDDAPSGDDAIADDAANDDATYDAIEPDV
jgi:hypothetical protein